jgi:hypothetical protein
VGTTEISAAVAAMTLLFGVYKAWRKFEGDRLREWQKVVVYSIIEKNFPEPTSFDYIRSRYLETVQAFDEFSIPRKQIRDSALVRVLLCLIEGAVIVRIIDGRYTIPVAGPSNQELFDRMRRMNALGDAILTVLASDSGRYSREELKNRLGQQFPFGAGEFEGLLNSMAAQGQVVINEGKVCRRP